MAEERIVLGDILTLQEHMWIRSSPISIPKTKEQWYIPDGVIRGKITLQQAIIEREARGFVETMGDPLGITTPGRREAMVISLEKINEETGQTENDPRILGIMDDESIEPRLVTDQITGQARNLTDELIAYYRKEGVVQELHLRPGATKEKENLVTGVGESNTGLL